MLTLRRTSLDSPNTRPPISHFLIDDSPILFFRLYYLNLNYANSASSLSQAGQLMKRGILNYFRMFKRRQIEED